MATRILIADDSLTIQKAFAMTFGGEDVTLLAARSADEGLTLARQTHPALVIADAVMPGRSGYDLCAAIKADPALRGIPVYILASSHNPYDEARARQSGVDGQFTKPFESVAIVERVKEAIAKGISSPAAAVRPPLAVVAAPPPTPPYAPAAPRAMTPPGGIEADYGEITINPVSGTPPPRPMSPALSPAASAAFEVTPPPTVPLAPIQRPTVSPTPPFAPATSIPAAASAANPPSGLRPSLIPGLRPGAVPAARPGAAPVRAPSLPGGTVLGGAGAFHSPAASPPPHGPAPIPGQRAPVPAMPQVSSGPARTLVGLPTSTQIPARFGAPAAPARPPTQPVRPLEATRTPPPAIHGQAHGHAPAQPTPVNPTASSAITSKIDQTMAALSAKGPEYEAIAKLSREIIEKVVWEVVPELVELIVREELQKRGRL
jgi:CheY-like chemotaxis protein